MCHLNYIEIQIFQMYMFCFTGQTVLKRNNLTLMVKRIILLVFNLSSSDWEFTYSNRQKQKSWVFGTAVKVPISPSQLARVQFSALLPTKADRGTRHVMPPAAGALPTTWASWTSSCLLARSPAVTGIWRVNQKIRALSLSIIPKKKKEQAREKPC